MAFSVLTQVLFSDNGLSIGLAKANAALRQLEQAGPGAHRGVRLAEQGIRSLAFEAVGLQGPLGRVAEGLLRFGGGSALVLGAAAGIGLIGLAWRQYTKDAQEAEEANKKLITEVARIGPHGQLIAERARLSQLQRQREAAIADERGRAAAIGVMTPQGIEQLPAIIELDRQIATQTNVVARAQQEAAEWAKKHADELTRAAVAAGKLTEEQQAALAALKEGVTIGLFRAPKLTQQEQAAISPEGVRARVPFAGPPSVGALPVPTVPELGVGAVETIGQDIDDAITGIRNQLRPNLDDTKALVVASFGAMAQAAILGSDQMARAFITGITAILQSLPGMSPFGGALIGVAGGILGALLGGGRPAPVKVTNFNELKRHGPDRVTVQIVSPSTGELLDEITYEMGRRQRRDQVVRIPVGVPRSGIAGA